MSYQILLIEDDPMIQMINKTYIEQVPGFEVAGMTDSNTEAITLLDEMTFDLILIDLNLKGESALDFMKALRQRDYPAEIIMLTAQNDQRSIQIGYQYGAIDYILKPFTAERLQESLYAFKARQDVLQSTQLDQADVDRLYGFQKEANEGNPKALDADSLEKGITAPSLKKIMAAITTFNGAFTIEGLTEEVDFSHVTVRKYIHFLAERGYLETDQEYGGIGRPITYYSLTDKGAN